MTKENDLISYPVNCPACQDSPDMEPDTELAKGCDTCKGQGLITLQMTEDELADLYHQYIELTSPPESACPAGFDSTPQGKCPVSGAK